MVVAFFEGLKGGNPVRRGLWLSLAEAGSPHPCLKPCTKMGRTGRSNERLLGGTGPKGGLLGAVGKLQGYRLSNTWERS